MRKEVSAGQKTVAQLQSKAAKRTESINLPVSCFAWCSARLRGARCFNCVSAIVRFAVTRGHISFIVSLSVSNALFPLLRLRTEPFFLLLWALQSSCNCIDSNEGGDWGDDRSILLLTADVLHVWDVVGVLGAQLKGRNAAAFLTGYVSPSMYRTWDYTTDIGFNKLLLFAAFDGKKIYFFCCIAFSGSRETHAHAIRIHNTHIWSHLLVAFFPAVNVMCGKIRIVRFCLVSIDFFLSQWIWCSHSQQNEALLVSIVLLRSTVSDGDKASQLSPNENYLFSFSPGNR